jgi:GT2 family glycosyltransferase/SAM-dependent methyltransferase
VSGSYQIKPGYTSRQAPEYFDDTRTDVIWQPTVYRDVAGLARHLGATRIVDFGCGSGAKLAALAGEFETVGLDYGANIRRCHEAYPHLEWIDVDFDEYPPFRLADPSGSVLVCADVLEHLVRPERLVETIRVALDGGALAAVFTTPDRTFYYKSGHTGPPHNPSHVREWTSFEFEQFLAVNSVVAMTCLTQTNSAEFRYRTIFAVSPAAGMEAALAPWWRSHTQGLSVIREYEGALSELERRLDDIRAELARELAEAQLDAEKGAEELRAALQSTGRDLERATLERDTAVADQHAARERTERLETELQRSVERSEAIASSFREITESEAFRLGKRLVEVLPLSIRLRHRQRLQKRREAPAVSRTARRLEPEPTIGVVVPVYNGLEFLDEMMASLARGTRTPDQVVLVNDASTEEGVCARLREYTEIYPFVSLIENGTNVGISEATNCGIRALTTDWIAFVDCDDFVSELAFERIVETLASADPPPDFVYSNRVDVDEYGHVVTDWDFTSRSTEPPLQALQKGMFASHLKVVRATALSDVGLFRSEFDLSQDYDLALRLAEAGARFHHVAEPLYFHRVHQDQQSQRRNEHQTALASAILARSRERVARRTGSAGPSLSVIMLALDRPAATERALRSLLSARGRPEIVLLDNGSDASTRQALAKLARDARITALRSDTNLGCGGGREFAASEAAGDYLFFVDNDMEFVDPEVALKLVERLEAEPEAAACCCKVVFPNGLIQFNGGMTQAMTSPFVKFELVDAGMPAASLATLRDLECDWIPGGATMWRRSAYFAHAARSDMPGAFEDNEHSLRVRAAHLKLLNAPTAQIIHHHYMFDSARSGRYEGQRYDRERILASLAVLYREHKVIPYDQGLFDLLRTNAAELPSLVAAFAASEGSALSAEL